MSEAAIQFLNIVKRYGTQSVLEDVSLSVAAGEYVGLVGVNGAGKTTLIKSLLDFGTIDAGSISIFGVAHTRPESRTRLAYLPERFLPPHYLNGREFLRYMANLHGVDYNEARVGRMLQTLDLDDAVLAKPVRQFSKGMAQKLGLAACFLSDKDLLVLDEPMSGLDPKARALLKAYLLELKGQGRTLFFSTHMLADVEQLCDRIAILHHGKLRFSGSPAECCATYSVPSLEQAYMACISTAETPAPN
jgi:ABC-2 type transport system ATP-binding protein